MTPPTSTESAPPDDIEQSFLDYDGVNGRDGQAGVDALEEWYEDKGLTYPPTSDEIDRDAVNYAHCVSFGLGGCDASDPDGTQAVMFREGVSLGRTGTGDADDFDGDAPTTNFHNEIWFDRCPESICGGGYIPPGGHRTSTTTVNNGQACDNGLTVMSQYIDSVNSDDGCRPPNCDFGRDADGWCMPPADADPPVVYVIGPADVDEDGGDAAFRVALSHTTTRPVAVTVATQDGTANAGSDYTQVNRRATVPANRRHVVVSVPVTDDTRHEPDETFSLQISAPSSNAALSATPEADATINDDDVPPLLLNIEGTPSVVEGGSLNFTVRPDQAPATEATVRFRVKDAYYSGHPLYVEEGYWCGQPPTADYARISNDTLTFPVGQTWGESVSIRTCDDNIDEQDKTITVELFDETAAGIGTRTATGTLLDNDAPSPYPTVTDPTFFINSPTVTEGDDLNFTLTFLPIGAVWAGSVTVTLTGTATLAGGGAECSVGIDAHFNRGFTTSQDTYSRGSSRWQGGATTGVPLLTCDDLVTEDIETLTATLSTSRYSSHPWGRIEAAVGNTGTGTIIDDDVPQVTLEGPVSAVEGSPLGFKVKLDSPSISDVVVTVSTVDDPAATHPASAMVPGLDYQPTAGRTVTILAGAVEAAVPIATVSDTIDEYDETLLLRIDDVNSIFPAQIGTAGSAVGTITDDDTEPTITVYNASAVEGDMMSFTLTLSHPSQKGVTVAAATSATGSAAAVSTCGAADGSEDYEIGSATVAFAPMATTAVFTVTVCDDTAVEGNETFLVAVSPAVHASVGTLVVTATIIDNDTAALCSGTCPPPVIQNALLTNTAGGDLTLRISMDFTLPGVVPTRTFTVTATGGTAAAGTHFDLAATTLTFDAATPIHEITIPTYVRYDHGTSPRTFTITIQDTDPNRSHITVTATGTLNPPAIGRQ